MDKAIINQLPDEQVRGKRVLVRLDVDDEATRGGAIFSEQKLRESLPTLEYLTNIGARVIIGTHVGYPGGKVVPALRLDAVADRLSHLLGRRVSKLDEAVGSNALRAVAAMGNGEVLMLENLRFYPGEDANDSEFARELGQLCDIYCDDAFALAYRGLASTVGITRRVRPAVAGLALARELMMFEAVLDKPDPPFLAIMASSRIEEKLPILENLLPRLNRLFIGGALSFTFMKAKGREVGAAPVYEEFLPLVGDFLRKAEKDVEIVLPQDFIVVNAEEFWEFKRRGCEGPAPKSRRVLDDEITSSDIPLDIGPWTVNRIKELIDGSRTIFWNGPLGMWEIEPFAEGTREVARALAERVSPHYQRAIVCGERLAHAIRSFNIPFERLRHLSAGGQSAIELLAGNPLPAVAALDNEVDLVAPIERRPRRLLLPVDGSAHSLEAARRLSLLVEAEGAQIYLLYVSNPDVFSTGDTWVDPDLKRQREVERRLEAERIFGAVNGALAEQGLISHQQVMVEGDPADQILKFADEIGADLIAMGSHGRTGVLRLLIGSVSRKVSDHAKCPVLIARVPDAEMAKAGMMSF
ncbi:MAG TPA: phosphoglycerate kinase [Blastocatellia bacterium]|nr:phosphoglycerate kinase [Blastocatellia bacterium]